ncbi:MAG TPA: hypothetical protein DCY61_05660 [Dehalococcoidia bacterium]|nr:hypothetical protein [Dehalococcoidia bacterium]
MLYVLSTGCQWEAMPKELLVPHAISVSRSRSKLVF